MHNIRFESSAINASECISQGWTIVTNNFGLYLGISLLALLMTACIPCINIFLYGPVIGGVMFCFLKEMRNEPVSFGDMFKGFENFVPLMVIGIIQSLPEIISQIIQYTVNIGQTIINQQSGNLYQSSPREAVFAGVPLFLIVVGILVFITGVTLRIALIFALPLIIEHKIGVGEAIKLSAQAAWKNIGGIIALFVLEVLVSIAGLLALCIGIFVAVPVIFAANAAAYRQVFPDSPFNAPNVPPAPEHYGGYYGTAQ